MFFWLPYYLNKVSGFSKDTADNSSNFYDWGQILGGFICGWIGDTLGYNCPGCVLFLLVSIGPTFVLRSPMTSVRQVKTTVFFSGMFIGGPANLISSAISADLGRHKSLAGKTAAMATVAGFIDGTASFGAAITQYVVTAISNIGGTNHNWEGVFIMLCFMVFASALLISNIAYKELRLWCRGRNLRADHQEYLDEKSGETPVPYSINETR